MSRIKECIIPRNPKGLIMEVDYKQLEVVILAFLSQDSQLIKDLNDGLDMHTVSTTFLTGYGYDDIKQQVDKGEESWINARKKAKACSFLVQFGGGANTLAKNTGIAKEKAQEFIDNYYKRYPEVKAWQDAVSYYIRTHQTIVDNQTVGQWESPFGTLYRFTKKEKPWDRTQSDFMPTEMKNYPIQGTAADVVKIAFALIVPTLHECYGDKVKVVNTIHDSFIIEVLDPNILEELSLVVEHTLTTALMEYIEETFEVKFPVPLGVDIEVGKNWNELEDVERYVNRKYYSPANGD